MAGSTDEDVSFSIKETVNTYELPDGYVLAGQTESFGAGQQDIWVIKLGLDGSIQWQKTFGGHLNESGGSVLQTLNSDGQPSGYAVAGNAWSFGQGGDMFVLRLNEKGNITHCKLVDESQALVSKGSEIDNKVRSNLILIPRDCFASLPITVENRLP